MALFSSDSLRPMKPIVDPSASDPEKRVAALACIPMKHAGVAAETLESGELVLIYPIVMRPWLDRLLRRFGRDALSDQKRKIQLDTLGTQVWGWIDGERSVGDIVARFGEFHKLPQREAELSVTTFLRMLGKRGLIGLREP